MQRRAPYRRLQITACTLERIDYDQKSDHFAGMPTVSKSALKARMLEYFRQVEESGEPLVVTDHGRPVLRVVPMAEVKRPAEEVLAAFRARAAGKLRFIGDPDEPTTAEWADPWGEQPLA